MAKIVLDKKREAAQVIVRKVKSKAALYGVNYQRLALAAGVCLKTFYTRMQRPETFSYRELFGLAAVLKTSVAYLVGEDLDDAA